jgi:hypothetical protein
MAASSEVQATGTEQALAAAGAIACFGSNLILSADLASRAAAEAQRYMLWL